MACRYLAKVNSMSNQTVSSALRDVQRIASQTAPTQRKATDAEVQAWIDRHDLGITLAAGREVFEDAQTLVPPGVQAVPPTGDGGVNG